MKNQDKASSTIISQIEKGSHFVYQETHEHGKDLKRTRYQDFPIFDEYIPIIFNLK